MKHTRPVMSFSCFLAIAWLVAGLSGQAAAQPAPNPDGTLPIGVIQGAEDVSPFRGDRASFRGVVTGVYEDRNAAGVIYYTLFVQNLPDEADGDPATSDGMAIFFGRQQPPYARGDRLLVSGEVTEFFGFTELDEDGLGVTVEEEGAAIPEAVYVDPPADLVEQAAYFEPLESMRVAIEGEALVIGPAHIGCGFAVALPAAVADAPIAQRLPEDAIGQAIPVLYPTDVDCREMPQVKVGDRIRGIAGPLVYNFDQYKILLEDPNTLEVTEAPLPEVPVLPALEAGQFSVATLNMEDYFDAVQDIPSSSVGEVVFTADELAARQTKMVHLIGRALTCPTLLGIQEAENEALLRALAAELEPVCGFVYDVSHRESPDGRGIDNALLSDPRRVIVSDVELRQVCSPVPTEVDDNTIDCAAAEFPLFGRPPLEVTATVDQQPVTIYVNHFKSKRGGAAETALERLAQGRYLNALAAEQLNRDAHAWLIAMGDFNDFEQAPSTLSMTDTERGGVLIDVLAEVEPAVRYSYNFGGVVSLLDSILVSPALADSLQDSTVIHSNAGFPHSWRAETDESLLPFGATDHDVPLVVFELAAAEPEPAATDIQAPTATAPLPTPEPATAAAATATPAAEILAVPPPAASADPEAVVETQGRLTTWQLVALVGILVAAAILVMSFLRRGG